ncbi:PaaX family transcriptional regulator [Nocardioides mesophilus]|uniref:PaaX family transcriptional regulator n=1 Tax=Nocardioides mesophilus TaxID=433659 RepID=A0A7G9R800_9ACTN|nr:PaaX family transcriptional regulator C-terminal domain-containing protein [Nocardioides mesophilus]QNN51725.1 PaaX family transcriptional regulator [Nocardioides mesophilus]
MHARSALFDVYGDHLLARGGAAPVAVLVRLLRPLGITAPAVRTAISRMVRQGWLEAVRLPAGPGYRLTEHARRRLDDAAARIYRTRERPWTGSWDLLVLQLPTSRSARERIRSGLGFLGYAALTDSTWISPFASAEVQVLLDAEGIEHARFAAADERPAARAAQAWDLEALASAYRRWHQDAKALVREPASGGVDGSGPPVDADEHAFAVRSRLVHEWRKFLFSDPGLPAELLPPHWPGDEAARFFAQEAERLLPAASRHVDTCLAEVGAAEAHPGAVVAPTDRNR